VWRWRYFGWLFPNTFYVKSSGTGTLSHGLYYLRRFAEDYNAGFFVLLIFAGWPATNDRGRRDLFALATLVAGAFAVYAVKVGGDFMGLYRFILPALPLGALAAQEALRQLYRRLLAFVPRPALWLALVAIAAGYGAASWQVSRVAAAGGSDQGVDSPGYLKHYVNERIPVGVWMAQQASTVGEPLASVGGAGVIPYYSGMRSFDTFGLVDTTIAHDPRMTSSAFRPGHQKWVSDEYLFRRRPTIITHVYCLHERCAKDRDHWLRNGYEWVTATIPGLGEPPLYSFLKRLDVGFGPFPPAGTH
jgi:hypothetical protein